MEFSQSYREMSILRKISRFFKLIGLRFKARKESRKEHIASIKKTEHY